MSDQAKVLRGLMERRQIAAIGPLVSTPKTAQTIAVTSGKGGVGKSNIALNLAIALARRNASVCLLDANMGLGNIDLLCGLNGYWNLSHVINGARDLKDVILCGPAGVNVIPGASGLAEAADCPEAAQDELLRQLRELERTHDFLIVDTGTGIHRTVRQFVTPADVVLVVTTPEPTSIADAYATIKALSACEVDRIETLVNQADSHQQARAILGRLQQTSRMFLRRDVVAAGRRGGGSDSAGSRGGPRGRRTAPVSRRVPALPGDKSRTATRRTIEGSRRRATGPRRLLHAALAPVLPSRLGNRHRGWEVFRLGRL